MNRLTKKQAILDICEREEWKVIAAAEVKLIKAQLEELLGEKGKASDSYIVGVLRAAGKPVSVTSGLSSLSVEPEYAQHFAGVLKFDSFESAERSIQRIAELHRQFKQAGDAKGAGYARQLALLGKRRAQAAARAAKTQEKRAVKTEIAEWFTIWLYSPQIFEEWVYLRKRSPEFVEKFGPPADQR
jgi:hypothetical protein